LRKGRRRKRGKRGGKNQPRRKRSKLNSDERGNQTLFMPPSLRKKKKKKEKPKEKRSDAQRKRGREAEDLETKPSRTQTANETGKAAAKRGVTPCNDAPGGRERGGDLPGGEGNLAHLSKKKGRWGGGREV